jgi:hypothetical protein
MIALSESRVITLSQVFPGRQIIIKILDFFNNYTSYFIMIFHINIINQKMHINSRDSLIFKYKDTFGLQFENINGENGFIIFGYFNSTDPKQIYNIKKDGLAYNIKLNQYLFLQSNIFGYEIRGIKIIAIPETNSGLYFISNITKKEIKLNDIIDYNTEISLYFSRDIIKKGNYLLKFAGVLEEANFEKINNYSDNIISNEYLEDILDKYEEFYENNRNKNIIGRAALVQINIFDDIKIFCDKKYDETCLKSNNICLTCGEGKYYDVENANEITQLLIGENYYFDNNKKVFIKCHERCKKCSKEYNSTNMQCDECLNETFYFLRDNNCLEKSLCPYYYYYDLNFDLFCINRSNSCPDIKPYELSLTKECIEKCELEEFNDKCNPTNNIISIKNTYNMLINNIDKLNLKHKLYNAKEKYIISGNNISFIFTTNEIEKNELFKYNNFSSILLNECENILKSKYSIKDEISLIILKIENMDNHSDYINVYYEVLNPLNLSQKLNLTECQNNLIEIRLPIKMKEYHLNLIKYTKEMGYDIFNLNDPFYNDICSTFTYNNSDISLSERKNLLDLSHENFCIENCIFTTIDNNT